MVSIFPLFLLNIGSLGMVYGFRLATCQKAEIQHWWAALCSDLCDWFSHLSDEGHLVAEGSHGPRWQGGVAGCRDNVAREPTCCDVKVTLVMDYNPRRMSDGPMLCPTSRLFNH